MALRLGWRAPENRSQVQCNPIIVDGALYGTSPGLALFALDAATGEKLWRFDPFGGEYGLFGAGVNRGVTLWNDRILYTAGDKLYAVSRQDGQEIFSIDLHVGLPDHAQDLFLTSNTPGIIFEDLLILGHRARKPCPLFLVTSVRSMSGPASSCGVSTRSRIRENLDMTRGPRMRGSFRVAPMPGRA